MIPFELEKIRRLALVEGWPPGSKQVHHSVTSRVPRAKSSRQRLRSPGEQAQVDWAHFGKVRVGRGRRQRRLVAFVMVLSYSRDIFLRFYFDAKMSSFLRGHVAAFEHFGGVPRTLLYDNLKNAVAKRYGAVVRFHPTLLELAGHYCFKPRSVAPGRGNEQTRVERAIGYTRTSSFAARNFTDIDDLNVQADKWCAGTARDRKWLDDRRKTVRMVFEKEQSSLLPLPASPLTVELLEEGKI